MKGFLFPAQLFWGILDCIENNVMKYIFFLIGIFLTFNSHSQKQEWIKTIGGANFESPSEIIVDSVGNTFILVEFYGTIDADPDGSGILLTAEGENQNTCLIKLTSNGNFEWAKGFLGHGIVSAGGLSMDTQGDITVAINFTENLVFQDISGTSEWQTMGTMDFGLVHMSSSGGTYWSLHYSGTENFFSSHLASNSNNDLLITGGFSGTTKFDLNNPNNEVTSNGEEDSFLLKLNQSGSYIWSIAFGSILSDFLEQIVVDSNNNIFAIGYFEGEINFDPSSGIDSLITSNKDIFFVKINNTGTLLFAKSFIGSSSTNHILDAEIDHENFLLLSGSFSEIMDFDPSPTNFEVNAENIDAFIIKLDNNGSFEWIYTFYSTNTTLPNEVWSLAVDSQNNIYSTGKFLDTVDFNSSPTEEFLLTSSGEKDIFLLKLEPNGNFTHASKIGGAARDVGTSIFVNQQDYVFLSGTFRESADLQFGNEVTNFTSLGVTDCFITKFPSTILSGGNFSLNNVIIYPTPVENYIFINLGKLKDNVKVTIYDSLSRIVFVDGFTKTSEIIINPNLQTGIYLIEIISNQENFLKKIVKN
ncbi:MAG: T9SS type A sorting domain-containing protein [Flavobacteriaceae bacterium]